MPPSAAPRASGRSLSGRGRGAAAARARDCRGGRVACRARLAAGPPCEAAGAAAACGGAAPERERRGVQPGRDRRRAAEPSPSPSPAAPARRAGAGATATAAAAAAPAAARSAVGAERPGRDLAGLAVGVVLELGRIGGVVGVEVVVDGRAVALDRRAGTGGTPAAAATAAATAAARSRRIAGAVRVGLGALVLVASSLVALVVVVVVRAGVERDAASR